jgi:hypothetical protein
MNLWRMHSNHIQTIATTIPCLVVVVMLLTVSMMVISCAHLTELGGAQIADKTLFLGVSL